MPAPALLKRECTIEIFADSTQYRAGETSTVRFRRP